MTGLYIAVAVMLLVILYHVLFIVVDMRKIMRRFSNLTEEVQGVLMKPLSIADQAMDWVMGFIEGHKGHHKKNDHHKH